jgi:hypothetical protein
MGPPECQTTPGPCLVAADACSCIEQQEGYFDAQCADDDGDVTITLD